MRTPSFKKNIAFNYLGQLYSTFIGILILPMFLQYMGAEAYGLVGFFTLLQAWLQLLDVGMSPTLGREVARLKNKQNEHWRLTTVVNTVELVFIGIALIAAVSLFFMQDWLASSWLTVEQLDTETITTAISIMAFIVAFRWVASINRSGINAYEQQVWMNVVDIIINTLRFPGALLLVINLDGNVLAYFYFQLVVVVIEVVTIRIKMRSLLPSKLGKIKRFSMVELKRIAPFALSVGYTSGIWILLTQLDKLLLSKYLTLSEYGYFTLVGAVANGMTMLSSPVTKALLPRMTAMLEEQGEKPMLVLYQTATKFVACFVFPIAIIIAFNAEVVIYTWTGDVAAAQWVAPILPFFCLGSMVLAIMVFQYQLQYAHGVLKYHVKWNTFSVLINIPLIIYAATYHGALGVAWVWLAYRLLSLTVWCAFVHGKFAPGLHLKWLINCVLVPFALSAGVVVILTIIFPLSLDMGRWRLFMLLGLVSFVSVALTALVLFKDLIRSKLSVKRAI